jgi:hypothetical protein
MEYLGMVYGIALAVGLLLIYPPIKVMFFAYVLIIFSMGGLGILIGTIAGK